MFSEDVFVRLVADVKDFVSGFTTAQKSVDDMTTKMKEANQATGLNSREVRDAEAALKAMNVERSRYLREGMGGNANSFAQYEEMNKKIMEAEINLKKLKEEAVTPGSLTLNKELSEAEKLYDTLLERKTKLLKQSQMGQIADPKQKEELALLTDQIDKTGIKIEELKGKVSETPPLNVGTDQNKQYDPSGINIKQMQQEIKQLETLRAEQAKKGDWAGVKETNLSIANLKGQLKDVTNVGIKDAKDGLNQFGQAGVGATTEVSNGISGNLSILDNMAAKLKGIGIAMLAAFSVKEMISFFKDAAKAADEFLQVEARLKGSFGDFGTERIELFASELSKATRVSKLALLDAAAFAGAQGRSEEMTRKLTEAAMNLSAVTGRDLKQSLMQLDMTLEGSAGRMGRIDGRIKDLSKTELENGRAVDIILEKYKGMAERMGAVGEGPLVQAEKKWHLIEKAIGKAVLSSDLVQGSFKGLNTVLDALLPREKQLSDIYNDESTKLNVLVKELNSQNVSSERKRQIIEEINSIYPGLLKGYDDEKNNIDKVNTNLREYNRLMYQSIALQLQKEKATEISKPYYEAVEKLVSKETEVREKIENLFKNTPLSYKVKTIVYNDKGELSEKVNQIYKDAHLAFQALDKGLTAQTSQGTPFQNLFTRWGDDGVKELSKLRGKIDGQLYNYVNTLSETTKNTAQFVPTGMTSDRLDLLEVDVKNRQEAMQKEQKKLEEASKQFGQAWDKQQAEREKAKPIGSDYYDDQLKKVEQDLRNITNWTLRLNELRSKPQSDNVLAEIDATQQALSELDKKQLESQRAKLLELKKASEQALSVQVDKTAWEKLQVEIDKARKKVEDLTVKANGAPSKELNDAIDNLTNLQVKSDSLKKIMDYQIKYGREAYNQVKQLNQLLENTTFQSPELQNIKIGFDWSDDKSWEKLKAILLEKIQQVEKENNFNIPANMQPQYDNWKLLYEQADSYLKSKNPELKVKLELDKDDPKAIEAELVKLAERYQIYTKKIGGDYDKLLLDIQGQIGRFGLDITPLALRDSIDFDVTWTEEDRKKLKELFDKYRAAIKGEMKDTKDQVKKEDFSLTGLIFNLSNKEDIEKVDKALSEVRNAVALAVGQQVEANQMIVDSYNTRIQEQESVVNREMELLKQGEANNVNTEKAKLAKLKAERDKALKEQREWQAAQMLLDTISQASSLATAAAEIFSSEGTKGLPGVIIAAGAIATMFSLFMNFKAMAKQSSKLREGGSRILKDGNYHEDGGIKLEGTDIEVEKGESIHVLRREKVNRYYNVLTKFVDQANSGKLNENALADFLLEEQRDKQLMLNKVNKETLQQLAFELPAEQLIKLSKEFQVKTPDKTQPVSLTAIPVNSVQFTVNTPKVESSELTLKEGKEIKKLLEDVKGELQKQNNKPQYYRERNLIIERTGKTTRIIHTDES